MSVARKFKVKGSNGEFSTVYLGAEAQYVKFQDGTNAETLASDVVDMKSSIDQLASLGITLNKIIAENFRAQVTGKIYTTKFPKYSVSTSYEGTKIDDNAGLVCNPSTLTIKGSNDYASIPMFKPIDCNWELDSTDGHVVLKALEGSSDFSKDGSNGQVGVVYMPWYFKTYTDDNYWYVSVSDKEYDGYTPLNACIGPDGTNYGFMVYSKYVMGNDASGKPISASGYYPISGETNVSKAISYNGLISYCHQLNNYYCAETAADMFFIQLQFMIKFATINSQSIFSGCTNYNLSYSCALAGSYPGIVISTANAANLVVGSTVSIGTSTNQNSSSAHSLARSKVIKSIEPLSSDESMSLVTLCEADGTVIDDIATETTAKIITMPWISGSCDNVLGTDGMPINGDYNASNAKYPFIIGGIEYAIGGLQILGNVVIDSATDGNKDVYICHDATALTSTIATIKASDKWSKSEHQIPGGISGKYISEMNIDVNNGIMIPSVASATSNTGFCDYLYTTSSTSGQYEWRSCGSLSGGSSAGAWYLVADSGLSDASWSILSRLSPNGMANPLSTASSEATE